MRHYPNGDFEGPVNFLQEFSVELGDARISAHAQNHPFQALATVVVDRLSPAQHPCCHTVDFHPQVCGFHVVAATIVCS